MAKLKINCLLVLLLTTCSSLFAATGGWADMNGGVTGGAGGTTVLVTNFNGFTNYLSRSGPYIVHLRGTITMPTNGWPNCASDKTIVGVDTNGVIMGDLQLNSVSNVIITNLFFSNPWNPPNGLGNCISLTYDIVGGVTNHCQNIWVDHCTFHQAENKLIDPTKESDFITISWCHFYYDTTNTPPYYGNFVCLIGSADDSYDDRGRLRETLHHNWFDSLCVQRMPRVRFGEVHCYNNYYGCPHNAYCVGVGNESQILLESSYFDGVNSAWQNMSTTNGSGIAGIIKWNADNVFVNTTIPTWAPNSPVFTPPYAYTLDAGSTVKTNVMAHAGALRSWNGPALAANQIGNQMQFSWPSDYVGWTLETLTNNLKGTNWVAVVGSSATNQITIAVNPTNHAEFFRVRYP